ncbi:GerMN domain-containing protein [Deinococcus lacus]|uniref:GerMN domain-containing protein n=1 Tax=Deinococcus lacus TaxID=392561 RepID=A0ABW1YA34_9DEIO
MMVLRSLFSFFNVVALLLLAAAYFGLQWVSKPPQAAAAPHYSLSEREPVKFIVYFTDSGVQELRPESRSVPVVAGESNLLGTAQAALTVWAAGPTQDGSVAVVPQGLPTPEVWMRGEHYYVSLPGAYRKIGYGVSGEHMMLCSLTRTLLEKNGLDVTFLVDRKNVETLGALDLREPFHRQDCADKPKG